MYDTSIVPWSEGANLDRITAAFLAGYKPVTRKTYFLGLKIWFRWCADHGIDPLKAQRPHIDLWGRWLEEERQSKPATVMSRLCILRSFYRYLEDEDIIFKSPAARVRLPRVSTDSQTRGLDRAEVSRFLITSEYNPTYHAMCCLLALNGLRISEACGANVEDLGVERGHRTLTVTRKGGNRQTIPLSPKTARIIESLVGERTEGPILITGCGTRMTRSNAAKAVARIGKKTRIETKMHPHRLRHAFVTIALDAGVPLHDVQDSAGHADPRTTMRYNRNRFSLDRNATHIVTAFLAGG